MKGNFKHNEIAHGPRKIKLEYQVFNVIGPYLD